jgi:hypothetical protein
LLAFHAVASSACPHRCPQVARCPSAGPSRRPISSSTNPRSASPAAARS